ncbi:alpha/beta hydrolase [Microbacterium sp. SSM24]|uniref:alpha/beta hydrolase n=1 Tax=Microbacterium sp. SSM24 TaxID=2991714 RepID=UPI0022277487|nr:alpha/beta hydrolase [Microbacterium sp. SSM24]MCW3492054.1 alpha/beta hydrolase [Microbacterium sp. SSM24]
MNASPRRRARRVVAVVAALAAASVALSGCFYAMIPDEAISTSSPAPDTAGVPDDLLPYYEQTLDWAACDEGFDCTMVTAPLDWADPSKGDIELSVIRSRAEGGEAIGSLLTNPGGPGASGVELIRDSLTFAVGEPLREQFDVIGFDPRGVGESTAVTCFDDADMDAYLYDIPENERGSDAWTDELLERHAGFAEACDENSDGILPYITTENSARDMDLLRAVLGDSELNYLGYSYGTFLGATYAELFPDKVGRLVLDGAVDPAISGLEMNVTQGVGFESALRAYMAHCLESRECPFRGSVDDAMADLGALMASVDRNPLPAADGRELGADSLLTAIVAALYSEQSWDYLTLALDGALQGDPETAFILADFYNNREGGTYYGNQTEAFRAYNCMDYPVDATDVDIAAAKEQLASEAPTVAPYWFGPDPCEVWPYPATGTRGEITAEGAAPIVVVGTTNDPATPYEWSVSLAEQLASGVLITREGEGHTGYNKGSDCVDDAVEKYLLDGTVPQDGLTCG